MNLPFLSSSPQATIAFNMRWRRGPYGGGNQWLGQVGPYLERCGIPRGDQTRRVRGLRSGNPCRSRGRADLFLRGHLLRAKEKNPRLKCIQRINDNDVRKGTDKMG